jgi:hypothetical protein
LFATSTDVVVADLIEFFLILAVDGLALGVEHGVGGDNAELFGFGGDDFEFNWFEVAADDE